MVLYRHLVNQPEIDLEVLATEPKRWGLRKMARWLLGFLGRTCLHRFAQDILVLWRGGWIDADLPAPGDKKTPTVVMTVAHGDAYYAATRYAQRYNLPLVTIFHDWWPEMPALHRPFRAMLERRFQKLYQESALALCVSPGMREELGGHSNAKVLYPMSSRDCAAASDVREDSRQCMKLLYAGNLSESSSMLIGALTLLKDHPNIRFEVRGSSKTWPELVQQEMTDSGLLLPHAADEEFNAWLRTADAFLITQSFEERNAKLRQTNFPSKLIEFAQHGKPLVVWGPDKASGVTWARESGQALVVNQEDPGCLVSVLEALCESKQEQTRLASAAREAAEGIFNPEHIQSDFLHWLGEVAVEYQV